MITYRIKDWNDHYENNKSREREKCSFCCVPNKQDGLGYGMLMREKDGEALYGAFVAVVLIASKQKKRKGYLTANGLPGECPLSARQLSVKCQFKESTIQRMLDVCSTNEIGWIEAVPAECPLSAREVPAECPPSALEGKGREGKEGEGIPPVKKLSASEAISFEKEIGRVTKELTGLGRESDYAPESKLRKRIVELRARQQELRKLLGVTA
jgi:hypothetical protein